MPTSRKTKPQLRAPYFLHMIELFPPVSERSLYTFQQIVLNEAHFYNSKTYISFRAWKYSCITHNYLMAEQNTVLWTAYTEKNMTKCRMVCRNGEMTKSEENAYFLQSMTNSGRTLRNCCRKIARHHRMTYTVPCRYCILA